MFPCRTKRENDDLPSMCVAHLTCPGLARSVSLFTFAERVPLITAFPVWCTDLSMIWISWFVFDVIVFGLTFLKSFRDRHHFVAFGERGIVGVLLRDGT